MVAFKEEFEFAEPPVTALDIAGADHCPNPPSGSPAAGIQRLSEMVADPEIPVADISRLIAQQIAGAIEAMTDDSPRRRRVSQRELNDQVRAYRDLQKTLAEGAALSMKDVLNLDGPKFKHVFIEIIKLFQKALKDAGTEQSLGQNIMLQFGDLIKGNEEKLRRELSKIDSGR